MAKKPQRLKSEFYRPPSTMLSNMKLSVRLPISGNDGTDDVHPIDISMSISAAQIQNIFEPVLQRIFRDVSFFMLDFESPSTPPPNHILFSGSLGECPYVHECAKAAYWGMGAILNSCDEFSGPTSLLSIANPF
jgi:hypothetical protein